MTVVGLEHYSVASQRWACMAAPIRDEEGGLLGIIDVSCLLEHAHAHTMGAVVSTAYAIEHMRKIQEREDEIELMRHSFRFLESQDPVLICDRKSRIVAVSRSLREALPPASSLRSVEEIAHYGFGILLRCPIYSSLHHRPIGECIHLQTVKNKEKRPVSLGISFDFPGEKGVSGVFQNLLQEVERLGLSDVTVHIFGESGTGKEVIARALHRNSSRKDRPFIAVNCGAIPQELMASELFGYVEGAFTGARKHGSKGKFMEADGGTIFLDEIGEIPYSMQVALLRVIQEREVIPLGSARPVPVDVRIITATNRDLKELVQEGKFREDLFYRLYVYPLCLPPLRKRKEDLPYLISYYCRKNRWNVTFPPDVAAKQMEYDWLGNVRELFNFLDRMRIVCGDRSPHISDVLMIFETHSVPRFVLSSSEPPLTYREQVQKQQMMQALQKAQGNVRQAAQLLNMPRSTFYRKMKKFRLS
ncbi:sigma-54-dependent Fis family transcriptional regulator [Bacillaceae bacterium]